MRNRLYGLSVSWAYIATFRSIAAVGSTSCLKRSAILYTSSSSTFTVLSCPPAITLEPATTTIFASNLSCPSPTSAGVPQDGTFEGNMGFPLNTSDQTVQSNGLVAEYEITSRGPFDPYEGNQYLLVTFSPTISKRDEIPSSGGVFNISQPYSSDTAGGLSLSVYAKAASLSEGDPANCTIDLCTPNACSGPTQLKADWTVIQFGSFVESSQPGGAAVFSVWCAAPAYVGLDNLATARRSATVSLDPSSQRQISYTQATVTVTSLIYHNATQTIYASASHVDSGSNELIKSITYTTVLPASTITETSIAPQLMTTVSGEAVTFISLSLSISNLTVTQTVTPSPSTLTLVLPASTEYLNGLTQTQTRLEIAKSIFEPSTLTMTTTLPAQTQTTYIYGPTLISFSNLLTTEVQTFTPSPIVEMQYLTYTLPGQDLTQTTRLIETFTPLPLVETNTLTYSLSGREVTRTTRLIETSTPVPIVETQILTHSLSGQTLTETTVLVQTFSQVPTTITQTLHQTETVVSSAIQTQTEPTSVFITQLVPTTERETTREELTTTQQFTTTERETTREELTATQLIPTTERQTTREELTTTQIVSTTERETTREELTATQQVTTTQHVTHPASTIMQRTTITRTSTRSCVQTGSCQVIASATNDGFESGVVSPWSVGSMPGMTSEIIDTTNSQVFEGDYSLSIVITQSPFMGVSMYAPLLCESRQYGASFAMWASATDYTGQLSVYLNIDEGPTANGYYAVARPDTFNIPLDASWHVYNYDNWTSRAGDSQIQYQFQITTSGQSQWNSDTSISIYVDAIKLQDRELLCN